MLISLYLSKIHMVGTMHILSGRGCNLFGIFKKQKVLVRSAAAVLGQIFVHAKLLFGANVAVALGRMLLLEVIT